MTDKLIIGKKTFFKKLEVDNTTKIYTFIMLDNSIVKLKESKVDDFLEQLEK